MLWSGYQAGLRVEDLPRDVFGAIAVPLRYRTNDVGLIAQARAEGMGLVMPGQAHLNQVAPDMRGNGFASLPYAQPEAIDVDVAVMSDLGKDEYAEAFQDAQIGAGATLITTPAHVFAEELSSGREQDLELAELSAKLWTQRQGWRPPAQTPNGPRRELFAALSVRGRHLREAGGRLVDLYADIDADGYWVSVFDAGHSKVQLAALTHLGLGLQERTGRPVVISGVGALHEALLTSGVASTCAGLHGMRPKFPPEQIDSEEVEGIAVQVYHPAILGVVPLGWEYEPALEWLFARYPCGCGYHPAAVAPAGRQPRVDHNTWCLAQAGREAARWPAEIAEQRLARRLDRARRLRRFLHLGRVAPGWAAVADAARSRRGDDDALAVEN